jgi:PAS domain S-box-containing protein
MARKPSYEELEQRVKELEKEAAEHKRAEESLRESKELFEKTFISQLDAIFILNSEGPPKIIDCNPATTKIFGYTREEMLDRTITFLHVNETTLKKFQENLYPAIEDRGYCHLSEFEMKRKDKTIFPPEHSVIPLRDDQGKRIGWVSVVRNISDRKRVEEALRESEERLRQIVQNMPVMLDALDEDNRILVWNRECERVTGYTPEEMIGVSNVLGILYPDKEYLSRLLAEWAERGDEFYNWEMDLTCKDGTVRTVAWSNISKRFPIPGWKSWAIGVDVSERKQAEEALRREKDTLEKVLAKIRVLSEWYASYLRSV